MTGAVSPPLVAVPATLLIMTQDELQWHYGSASADQDHATFLVLGPMPEAERQRLEHASRLLLAIGPMSPYAALHDQFRLFEQVVAEVEQAPLDRVQLQGAVVMRFGSAMDNVLFAFRAFLDRTAHHLSGLYGKDSAQLLAFKKAQSEEYDRYVEYRLCYKLRNMSQHVGHVISRVRTRGERDGTGVMGVVSFEVIMEPQKLLATYDDWGIHVRSDLEEMDDDIQVKDLVVGLETSCKTLMAHLLLAQADAVAEAISCVRSVAANCGGGEGNAPMSILIKRGDLPVPSDGRLESTFEPVPVELADLAERNVDAARLTLASLR